MNQTNQTSESPDRSRFRGETPASTSSLLKQLTDVYREIGLSKEDARQAAIADLMMEGRSPVALAA